jgi:poly[(R)-3-hydroxyalkanoate] polymerase subunit PhaC
MGAPSLVDDGGGCQTDAVVKRAVERTVEQVTHGPRRVQVVKQVLLVPLPHGGDQHLALVRKRPPGGQAPRGALLLVHGLAQNRYNWHLKRRSFSAYLASRGWDVFNLELRGHGRSRRLGARIPTSFEDYVDRDVPAALDVMATLGHDRPFVVGHSLGGAIAYAVAGHHPARLGGVVSLSGVFRWGSATRMVSFLSRVLHRTDRAHRLLRLGAGVPFPLELVGSLLSRRPSLAESALCPLHAWAKGSVEDDVLSEWLARGFDRTSGSVVTLMGRWARQGVFTDTAGDHDYAQAWARSGVPVLVIGGGRDRLAHADHDVRPAFLASTASDRTYRCFESYGHIDLVHGRRAPHEVWPCVAEWLEARAELRALTAGSPVAWVETQGFVDSPR